MNVDLTGMSILADRLELIRTIGRNIAGISDDPDPRGVKTQGTSALPDDPAVDGVVPKDDRSRPSIDNAGRERAALLSSLMQALRPPVVEQGQLFRQALNAALAQPLADLSLATHAAGDPSGLPLEGPWMAGTEPETSPPMPPFEGPGEPHPEQPDVKTSAVVSSAASEGKAVAEAAHTPLASGADGAQAAMNPTGHSISSALAARTLDASVQADLILRALGELELGAAAAGMAPMATERAGILASFVLNAHFLPGWPPARPIESPEAKALIGALAHDKSLSKSDIELLTYLASFGVSREHLEKLLKALKRAAKRPGLLRAFVCLTTNLSAALRALGTEMDAIITDLTLEEQMQLRHASGNRRRIDLG